MSSLLINEHCIVPFRRFTNANVCGTAVPSVCGDNSPPQNARGYTDIFTLCAGRTARLRTADGHRCPVSERVVRVARVERRVAGVAVELVVVALGSPDAARPARLTRLAVVAPAVEQAPVFVGDVVVPVQSTSDARRRFRSAVFFAPAGQLRLSVVFAGRHR